MREDAHSVTVRFYGKLADIFGRELALAVPPGTSVAGLRDRAATQFPEAAKDLSDPRLRAVVADEFVTDAYEIAAGDVIELLPAVSGG